MKILITGITGLLGSYLARKFMDIGELHGLKRKNSNLELLGGISSKIIWHEGDINDFQSLEASFEGKDLIIHSAGMVSYLEKDKENLLKVNFEGTANVVNVMLEKGIPQLLHISSVAAIGKNPETTLINEEYKWTDSPLNTPYAVSKHLAELEVWRGAQEGLNVMVFNPSVLLAKIGDARSSSRIYQYVLKENNYYPKGNINYIDIRDAVDIILSLYKKGQWNERYIINKESLPYSHFFGLMAKTMDKRTPTKALNGLMLNLVLGWTQLHNFFSSHPIQLTPQLARLAQQKFTFDNKKVQSQLNYKYKPLEITFNWAMGTKTELF